MKKTNLVLITTLLTMPIFAIATESFLVSGYASCQNDDCTPSEYEKAEKYADSHANERCGGVAADRLTEYTHVERYALIVHYIRAEASYACP